MDIAHGRGIPGHSWMLCLPTISIWTMTIRINLSLRWVRRRFPMLLERLNLDDLSYDLSHKANTETSQQRKNEALKRLQVVEAFRESKEVNKPEWMIVKVLAVIPPELRPLVPLDGGRFATSDLNDLYRRVIIRNNRLKTVDRDQGSGCDPA